MGIAVEDGLRCQSLVVSIAICLTAAASASADLIIDPFVIADSRLDIELPTDVPGASPGYEYTDSYSHSSILRGSRLVTVQTDSRLDSNVSLRIGPGERRFQILNNADSAATVKLTWDGMSDANLTGGGNDALLLSEFGSDLSAQVKFIVTDGATDTTKMVNVDATTPQSLHIRFSDFPNSSFSCSVDPIDLEMQGLDGYDMFFSQFGATQAIPEPSIFGLLLCGWRREPRRNKGQS
jgi:hypothetical protein